MRKSLFDGETIDPERDDNRLKAQLYRVKSFMLGTDWKTLAEIEMITGYPQASISARLRDLRKTKFGSFTVERRHVKKGLFEYRVLPPEKVGHQYNFFGDDADE